MKLIFKQLKLITLLVIGSALVLPSNSIAKISVGAGMAYQALKLTVTDHENRYFHTVLQSTLGVAEIAYEHPWFTTSLEVGWSDWNVSGEWQGTNINKVEGDLGWLAQQHYKVNLTIRPLSDLGLGSRFQDQRLRHHQGEIDTTFLDIRQRYVDFYITYDWYRTQGLRCFVEFAYAPSTRLVIYQNTFVPEHAFALHDYQDQVSMTRWQGKLGLIYIDSMGWRLTVNYSAGYSFGQDLKALKSLTIIHGQLLGLFSYDF